MVKKALTGKPASIAPALRPRKNSYAQLLRAIEQASTQMVGRAASIVNQALVLRNWLVGAYLVEYEQGGADRAKYGDRLLDQLAEDLVARGMRGLGKSILERCRSAYLTYPQLRELIPDALSTESDQPGKPIPYTLSTEFKKPGTLRKPGASIRGTPTPELPIPLTAGDVLQTERVPMARRHLENFRKGYFHSSGHFISRPSAVMTGSGRRHFSSCLSRIVAVPSQKLTRSSFLRCGGKSA